MTELDLHAGIELGQTSLDAMGNLTASCNSLAQSMARRIEAERAYQYGPTAIPISGVGTSPSNGADFVFGLNGPENGYVWEIRRLVIGGPSPITTPTPTGTAYFFVSAMKPSVGNPAMFDMFDSSTSWPNVAFYSGYQVVLHYPQRGWVYVTGANDSQQILCAGVALNTVDKRVQEEQTL